MVDRDGLLSHLPGRKVIFAAAATALMLCGNVKALNTRDYAIEVSAFVQESPPQIMLAWPNNGDGLQYLVQRKLKGDTQWNSGVVLSSDATSYIDSNVSVGSAYEYSITQYPLPAAAISGYIYAGIKAPLIESRGRLVLIVDNTFSSSLSTELAQLQQDLAGDGWTVLRHDVSRTDTPPNIKSLIRNDYQADPANTRAVFLFGHVPVPYSGNYNADDHPDHTGAWVADTYYGDMDGNWTDSTVRNTSATRPANRNIPGDGKFDQTYIPSDIELQVGRVDLANMSAFAPSSELDLLRAYLNKDHDYRVGNFTVQRRALLFDGFGESGGEAYAASGWRNFAPFFGSQGTTEVGWGDFISYAGGDDYLWSYAAGGGDSNYMDCYGVGETGDFATTSLQTVFMMFFGSYFGDWDATNCIFRAPLCSGKTLAVTWAGRPHWNFHHMALGETIGYSTRLTQNNSGLYVPTNFCREVHISLLGDPTLRMHVVLPPSSISAVTNRGSVTLNWGASADSSIQGYYVYRATSTSGPFTRITGSLVNGQSFTDVVSAGTYVYMVRAVKLESTASGTYYNPSQGIFTTASVPSGNATPVTIASATLVEGGLQFQCAGQIGQTFVIDRSPDMVLWTPATTNSFSDSTNLVFQTNLNSSGRYFYRARLWP